MTGSTHRPGGTTRRVEPGVAFGRRLRAARLARGLSQEQLGQAADLDRTYISSCEAGRRNVTLRTLGRLADALDVHQAELIADPAELADLVASPSIALPTVTAADRAAESGAEYRA